MTTLDGQPGVIACHDRDIGNRSMQPVRTRLLEVSSRTLSLPGARLVVQRGTDRGRALKLESETVVVGTSKSAQLVLTDSTVSRNHFSLQVTDDGFLITDLQSTNGTKIDGRRIRSAFIEIGDRIEAGDTRLRLEAAHRRVDLDLSEGGRFGKLLGVSVAARRMFALLERIAPEDATVLLLGETGTGKDITAEAIHDASKRAKGPFVVFDCGAAPPGLLESELFGHERSAFTGASHRRTGVFEEAHGGTLFLDEIGEMPLPLQIKLLRAIDRREVKPLGSDRWIAVDIRLVAATNRDLKLAVNRGQFREDLYYRLSVVNVYLPPLRDRIEDLPVLAEHFWRTFTGDRDGSPPQSLLASLVGHDWPGNIRELRNKVERAAALDRADDEGIRISAPSSFREAKERAVDAFERSFLADLLARAAGNVSEAARLAMMDRAHLTKLLRRHGLHRFKPDR